MQITLQRVNEAVRFEGSNTAGNKVIVEGSPDIGGEGQGLRPMELLLVSLASCSSMDAVTILKKMRQPLEDIRVEVNGERVKDAVPAVFTKINLHFYLKGQLRPDRVEEALRLSVEKYCSVTRMLEPTVQITWEYSIENGKTHEI
ncbi:MAG TPA: OsmC family protein [Saprospiraceae bacterium]|nr:OsmC family protein [Saprospiraceae bacterium]